MLRNKEKLTKMAGKGLVSMCSWCKKIRDPYGNWIVPSGFFSDYFGVKYTHTICELCYNLYFPDFSPGIIESYQQIYRSHQKVEA